MSNWRTIDTAPKDGTWVLVFTGEKFDGTNFRAWEVYPTIAVAHLDGKRWFESGTESWGLAPTHWMPLPVEPSPPLSQIDGGERQ